MWIVIEINNGYGRLHYMHAKTFTCKNIHTHTQFYYFIQNAAQKGHKEKKIKAQKSHWKCKWEDQEEKGLQFLC